MQARVFVTGASGFVGSAIVDELLARRHPVHALLNRRPVTENARTFRGDIFDNAVLDAAMSDCDAVIHLVGIIMEHPSREITFERIHFQGAKNVIDAAVRNGIKRFIHMSALGVRPDAISDYHKTKYRAEEYLRASALDWTIFRPSMIHGPKGEFMQMAAKWSRMQAPPFLFMPYFGAGLLGLKGAGMLQPVYVNDVARAFVDALENPNTIGETYLLGGTQQLTWPQLHHTISQAIVGRKRLTIPLPVWKAKLLAAIGLAKLAGFNRDQIIMSQEDNTCDLTKFEQDFGWTPRGFGASLKEYASTL